MPKISVIVPIYNVEKYIRECLESILMQTEDDIEVILIDDCSTDASIDIARQIADIYMGKKIVRLLSHVRNGGLAAARNTGIKAASGDFIFFIDSDDLLERNDVFERMLSTQAKYDADIVIGNSKMFDDVTGRVYKVVDKDLVDAWYPADGSKGNPPATVVVWNRLIRREIISRYDLYYMPGIIYEDNLWSFMLWCNTLSVATISVCTYGYRCRANSTLTTLTPRHIYSSIIIPFLAQNYVRSHQINNKRYADRQLLMLALGGLTALTRHTDGLQLYNDIFKAYRTQIIPNLQHLDYKLRLRVLPFKLPKAIGIKAEQMIERKWYNQNDLPIVLKVDNTFMEGLHDMFSQNGISL